MGNCNLSNTGMITEKSTSLLIFDLQSLKFSEKAFKFPLEGGLKKGGNDLWFNYFSML